MRCQICDRLPPEHRPYVVWHTGCDGCEEHDRDYYDEGVVVCADCIEALRYVGIGLDGDACVIDLQYSLDMWAQDTLWHAFWTPERVTVCEADCARRYLDRSGNKDVDPAWDWLPKGTWSDVDEFKADLGSALCRRFLTDDMDGLAAAYLKQGDGWVSTSTQDVWKLAERLGGGVTARRGALTTGMSNAMNATSTKAATQTRSNTTAGRSKNAPSAPNVQNNQRKEQSHNDY